MHELAITEGIVDAAIPTAQKNGAEKILAIKLRIGELSGVVPECIQYYFDIVCKGTIAEGARLDFEMIPPQIRCRSCSHEGVIKRGETACPACGSYNFELTGGREYYVENLTVE